MHAPACCRARAALRENRAGSRRRASASIGAASDQCDPAGGNHPAVRGRTAERDRIRVGVRYPEEQLRVVAAGGVLLVGTFALVAAIVEQVRADRREGRRIVSSVLLLATWVLGFIDALVHASDAWASMPTSLVPGRSAGRLRQRLTRQNARPPGRRDSRPARRADRRRPPVQHDLAGGPAIATPVM